MNNIKSTEENWRKNFVVNVADKQECLGHQTRHWFRHRGKFYCLICGGLSHESWWSHE